MGLLKSLPDMGRVGLLLILVWLAGCTGAAEKADPGAEPPGIPAPDLSVRPWGLSQNFLELLERRDTRAAHRLLSAYAREEYPPERLGQLVAAWKGDLQDWRPVREEVYRTGGRVLMGRRDRPGERPWEWLFVREESGWKIDGLKGGPFPE